MSQSINIENNVWGPSKENPDWEYLPLDDAFKELKHHAQTAILIELSTIPLYLFAAYSIKTDKPEEEKAQEDIIHIVKQEMLHLGLAGNIFCSIRGTPKVYGKDYMPEYPFKIFKDEIEVDLAAATQKTIDTFVQVERPIRRPESNERVAVLVIPEYRSIGEFYESFEQGLKILDRRFKEAKKSLFDVATAAMQLKREDDSWRSDDMHAIINIETATKAIQLIVTQGEGGPPSVLPNADPSHYDIFVRLQKMQLSCFPAMSNPRTSQFEKQKIYKVMVACDAVYSYLLLTIQVLWTYAGGDGHITRKDLVVRNVRDVMGPILGEIAKFLVKQPARDVSPKPNETIGAAYNYCDLGSDPFKKLKEIAEDALAAYPELKDALNLVKGLADIKAL